MRAFQQAELLSTSNFLCFSILNFVSFRLTKSKSEFMFGVSGLNVQFRGTKVKSLSFRVYKKPFPEQIFESESIFGSVYDLGGNLAQLAAYEIFIHSQTFAEISVFLVCRFSIRPSRSLGSTRGLCRVKIFNLSQVPKL